MDRPEILVGQRDAHLHELDLLVEQDLARLQHGQRGDVGRLEQFDPLGARLLLEGVEYLDARDLIFVLGQRHRHLRPLHRPNAIAEAEDVERRLEAARAGVDLKELAVAAFEHAGDEADVAEAVERAGIALLDVRDAVFLPPVVHRALREEGVEQRGLHLLPRADRAARTHGGERRDRREERLPVMQRGVAEVHRPRPVRAALVDHRAEPRGDERFAIGPVRQRRVAAVGGERAGDERREIALEAGRVEAQRRRLRVGQRVDEDIGAFQQAAQLLRLRRDIELDAALAAIPPLARQVMGEEGAAERLDLHHLGAVIGQQHGGHRAGHDGGGFDDAQVRERSGHNSLPKRGAAVDRPVESKSAPA